MKETLKIFKEKHADFLKLNLPEAINWEKYNLMSVSHHSTAIEGSTLSEVESQLLLDEGTTPKGKPYEHSAMEKDHYEALKFVVKNARNKKKINPDYIRAVSAKVMHGTGQQFNVASGNFDSSRGEYRTIGVFAGKTTFPSSMNVDKPCLLPSINSSITILRDREMENAYSSACLTSSGHETLVIPLPPVRSTGLTITGNVNSVSLIKADSIDLNPNAFGVGTLFSTANFL